MNLSRLIMSIQLDGVCMDLSWFVHVTPWTVRFLSLVGLNMVELLLAIGATSLFSPHALTLKQQ